jgi:phospholipase C
VSPWVEPGSVYNEEYRHTSLIATLRKAWDLGAPFTQRDASARTFDHVFARGTPRDPQTWATVAAQPLPAWAIDYQTMGQALGYLGKDVAPGIIEHARQMGVKLPPQLDDPSTELTPQLIVEVIRDVAFHYFPSWRRPAQAIATEPTSHRVISLQLTPRRRITGSGTRSRRPE